MPNSLSLIYVSLTAPVIAQSAGDTANKTVGQAQEILAEITTWKFLQAILIILIAFFSLRIITQMIHWFSERVARDWRLRVMQFIPFVRTIILLTAVVMLMNLFLKLSQENILAVTGTAAVALGFAFKDYASSIIAGFVGLFEAPYRIGDRVQIGEHYGEVINFGVRGVRLRTPTDSIVTIPHNQIWTQPIVNANMGALEAQVVTRFYLDHNIDVLQVTEILYRVAQTSRYIYLKRPIVVVMEEKKWGSLFKLKCYPMDARDEFNFQTDLTQRAKALFTKYQIRYPQYFKMEQHDF